MDVFDLRALIRLDTSEYENGLSAASSLTSSFGDKLKNGLATAAKVGAAAIGAATAAVGAFAASSVKTGAEFDSAMSQISATMGITASDIANNAEVTIGGSLVRAGDTFDLLREKAMQMGSETNFSATQAAEGLNILAMSGFDAEQSMSMIEDVLHLAAAGAMDMGSAAGFVSGAMKGFNDDTKDSAYYADLMAKGATLANTDVTALGEALSGAAANAYSYGQSADTTTLALLRLAEQGDVGSAAATALGAAMKNLYAPTDQAKKLLQQLGVDAFDPATGSARDFNDVVNELDAALSGYSDEQKTAYAQTIFGIQGFDAYNKMVVTSTEKQEEWAKALAESTGEAAKQYETMTDNLTGDIDKWNSALEGFKLILNDQLTPSLREFTQFGTEAISTLSTAFQEGGLTGAMEALGTVLSDGLNMVIAALPSMIDAGMQLLGALGQGILDNLPVVLDSATQIIEKLLDGISSALPKLLTSALQITGQLASYISSNLPQLIPAAVSMVLELVDTLISNADMLVDSAIELTVALADGLISALPVLLEKAPVIIEKLVQSFSSNAPKLAESSLQIMVKLAEGLISNIPKVGSAILQIVTSIVSGFKSYWSSMLDIGKNIVNGIWEGISSMGSWIKGKVSDFLGGIVSTAKGVLGIASPSKVFASIGQFMAEGMSQGWDKKIEDVKQKVVGGIRNMLDAASSIIKTYNGVEYDPNVDYAALMESAESLEEFQELAAKRSAKIASENINLIEKGYADNEAILEQWRSAMEKTQAQSETTIEKTVKTVYDAVETLVDKGPDIGREFIESLIDGIEQMDSALNNAIVNVVDNAVNSAISRMKEGFGTANIDYESSSLAKSSSGFSDTFKSAVLNMAQPITVVAQTLLDKKVIGETAYKYNINRQKSYGG